MKSPIFVYDYSDDRVYVYSTKEMAETFLEAQDIPHISYIAYDRDGYQLEFVPASPIWVTIQPIIPAVNKSEELRKRLRDFLKEKEFEGTASDWLSNASLDELTTKALEYEVEFLEFSWSEWFSPLFEWLKRIFKP